MSATDPSSPRAWEPLTPRGVATFARASLGRLLLVELLLAMAAAGVVVWFLAAGWFPVVGKAIRELPPEGEMRGGELDWGGESPVKLAGNHLLAVGVDLTHSGRLARDAQYQLEFGRRDVRLYCVLGYAIREYPEGWRIAFNRTEVEPRWGAWEPELLAGAALGTVVLLLLSWALLATVYCAPARVLLFFMNRDLKWGETWRLAAAAQMPGAIFLVAGVAGHGLGWVSLVQLAVMAAISVLMGWAYLFISPGFLPRHGEAAPRGNPFGASKPGNKRD